VLLKAQCDIFYPVSACCVGALAGFEWKTCTTRSQSASSYQGIPPLVVHYVITMHRNVMTRRSFNASTYESNNFEMNNKNMFLSKLIHTDEGIVQKLIQLSHWTLARYIR
tara:strand:+ start:304 stop:633 length:330 start_codon:yes stop_codon:yes gene_type:complete